MMSVNNDDKWLMVHKNQSGMTMAVVKLLVQVGISPNRREFWSGFSNHFKYFLANGVNHSELKTRTCFG